MSARDELLKLHTPLTMDAQKQPEYRNNTESALHGYSEGVEHALDTVWAKGYRKPRTITTVEELDALPVGSVILDTDAYVGRKERVKSTADWSVTLHKYSKQGAAFSLPATVLHEPEAEATR